MANRDETVPRTNEPADVFAKIERRRTSDSVVDRVQSLLVDGTLQPGDFLPSERELAATLGVSRNVLREALGMLSQKGLVRVIPGQGTQLVRPESETIRDALTLMIQMGDVDLLELCDARMLIEPDLAALAASRATDESVAALEQLLDELDRTRDDLAAHIAVDYAFHEMIATVARHNVLKAVVAAMRGAMVHGMKHTTKPQDLIRGDEDHRAILEAIRRRDPEAARAAVQRHIEWVRKDIYEPQVLEQHGDVK